MFHLQFSKNHIVPQLGVRLSYPTGNSEPLHRTVNKYWVKLHQVKTLAERDKGIGRGGVGEKGGGAGLISWKTTAAAVDDDENDL